MFTCTILLYGHYICVLERFDENKTTEYGNDTWNDYRILTSKFLKRRFITIKKKIKINFKLCIKVSKGRLINDGLVQ